jgi:hypothetical protein
MALRSLLVCGRGSAASTGRVHLDLLCHPPENAPQLPDELSTGKARGEGDVCRSDRSSLSPGAGQ